MSSSALWTTLLRQERARLLALAYRMLGSLSDAEDMLQEIWLRAQKAPLSSIEVPAAWLTTVLTRLCIDHLRSARVRREQYVGPWLPEPIVTTGERVDSGSMDPLVGAERISLALLRLLEALSPAERAVYVLHEIFEHSHAEIAEIVGVTSANCRQLALRARNQIASGKLRYAPSKESHSALLVSFLQAVQEGNAEALQKMLSQEVVLRSDGGGKVNAARKPIFGADRVARFLFGVAGKREAEGGWTLQVLEVNGLPSVVGMFQGVASNVVSLETDGQKVSSVFIVMNPDKMKMIQRNLKNF